VFASRVCFATAVLLVLLVGSFSGYIRSVRAETSETPVSSALNPDAPVEGGVLLDSSMDNTSVRDIATFERWDGKVLPENSLNSSVGDWPYLVTSKGTTFAVRRLNDSFEQGIPENAVYDFLPTGIKETLVFPVVPSGNVISILFTATYKTNVSGTNVTLLDAAGSPVWRTEPFHAWDSSETPVSWDSPVVSVSSADGQLVLSLDEKVLSAATYPLYIDPTWTLSSTLGWGSSTFQDATEDKGDHNIKIGMFADNFNDNTNEGQWVVESGSATFTTGVMKLSTSTTVKVNVVGANLWADYRFAYKIRFTQSGTAQAYFRYQDANNHYYLDMSSTALTLKKRFIGVLYTIATIPTSIAINTDYTAKLRVTGASLEVWWQGGLKWSGIDNQGPGVPSTGYIKFGTNGAAKVNVDDVRVWNTVLGTMTTAIRNATAGYHPTQTKIVGTVDAFNQTHVRIQSSPYTSWGPWTNLKSDMASTVFYKVPDQDAQQYYALRVTLTSGNEGTPALSELTTTEDNQPLAILPTSNTGFEPWYAYVGGQVNAVTGNVWYSIRDISVRARAFDLLIQRSYNSLRGSEAGPFGNGWTFNYNEKLVINPDTTVTWNDGDGSQQVFSPKGTTGGYAAPRGIPARLVKNGDGSFTLWRLDGIREAFDAAGKLTSIADKNGNKVTMSYTSGRLSSVADDSGQTLTMTYDGSGRITSIRDPINRYANYSYDGSSNLIQRTDPMGFLENYTYTANKIASIVDPVGKRTSFAYDGSNRATEIWLGFYQAGSVVWQFRQYAIAYSSSTTRTVTNARGFTTTITLNSFGNPTNMSGPSIGCGACDSNGNWSAYRWDGEMNKIKITDGRVNAWLQDFDHRSRPTSRTDPGGNLSSQTWTEVNTAAQYFSLLLDQTNFRGYRTSFTYDANGNLVTTVDPMLSSSYRTYTSQGFLATSTDFRGYQTNFTYETHGWLTQAKNSGGNITQYGYDAVGRRMNITTPLLFKTTYRYDADDRSTNVTDPLGNFTLYTYSRRGEVTQVRDPNGFVTLYEANVTSGRQQKITQPGLNVSQYTYDVRGSLITFTNLRNYNETYGYDAYDRRIRETRPGGNSTNETFDAAGNMISRLDANGNLTMYSYDKLNRIIRTTYPGSIVLTASYDANGNTLHATGFGYTRDELWDGLDRRASTTWNFGSFAKTISYQYDRDSHRARMNYSDGSYALYTWDSIGRLNKSLSSDGSTWWYAYDKDNRRTGLTYPNGLVTTWDYDPGGRITKVSTKNGGLSVESFAYIYDKAGNRLKMTEANNSWVSYSYDNLYRLLKETYSYGRTITYAYDAQGNRKTMVDNSAMTTYIYGKDDQMLRAVSGGVTTTFDYDRNGNLRTQTTGGAATTYAYDVENRITSTSAGGATTTFEYSAEGKRMKQVAGGATTFFGYDYQGLSGLDTVAEEYSSIGSLSVRREFGPGGDEVVGSKGASWSFYHRDGLGSVTRITSGTRSTVGSYLYTAFGTVRYQSGSSDRYRFTSRENVNGNSLYYLRARYYDTTTGRFLQADPAGSCGGPNSYSYTGSNPVNRVDPEGQCWIGYWTYFCYRQIDWAAFQRCFSGGILPPTAAYCGSQCIIPCVAGVTCLPCFAACGFVAYLVAAICYYQSERYFCRWVFVCLV